MKSLIKKRENNLRFYLACGLFAFLPLIPLFIYFYGFWGLDWKNHLFAMAYLGQYFRIHGSMPEVINSTLFISQPATYLYSFLIYPCIAFLSSFIGIHGALRIFILIVWFLQFGIFIRLFKVLTDHLWISLALTCIVTWSVYPLTNLYHRSALIEFVAGVLLNLSVACWLLVVIDRGRNGDGDPDPWYENWLFCLGGLALALSWASHPITALYSPFFVIPLIFYTWSLMGHWSKTEKIRFHVKTCVVGILIALAVAPWIYACRLFASTMLLIRDKSWLETYLGDLDLFWNRFSIFPRDPRTWSTIAFPHMDCQVNMSLFILVFGFLILFGKWLFKKTSRATTVFFIFSIFLFLLTSWMSVSVKPYNYLPKLAVQIQFLYRMINYQNLSLLFVLLCCLNAWNRRPSKSWIVLVAFCAGISFIGLTIKLKSAVETVDPVKSKIFDPRRSSDEEFYVAPYNYFARYYASTTLNPIPMNAPTLTVAIPIGRGDQFGIPEPLEVNLDGPTYVRTNILANPWNALKIDGSIVDWKRLTEWDVWFGVSLPAGRHVLESVFQPDSTWEILRTLSLYLTFGWVAALLVLSAVNIKRATGVKSVRF